MIKLAGVALLILSVACTGNTEKIQLASMAQEDPSSVEGSNWELKADRTDENICQVVDVVINGMLDSSITDICEAQVLAIEWTGTSDTDMVHMNRGQLLTLRQPVIKTNGMVHTLSVENGAVEFPDDPDGEENRVVHEFIGQVPYEHAYLLSRQYSESSDHILVDPRMGHIIHTFEGRPFFSPNGQKIICVSANPYEMTADLQLFIIDEKGVHPQLNASFTGWLPVFEPPNLAWASDQDIIVKALPGDEFWRSNGMLNEAHQFLRINILP